MSEDAIAELTQRLITLERRTADEAAAIRAELVALRGPVEPRPKPMVRPAPEPRDFAWLVGPRGFALAGGVVTIVGFAFLFALAASRGWIGPAARCTFGGVLSLALIGAGAGIKRRFDHDLSARAAVGTGIGGLYLSLFAATRLYHLLPQGLAWPAVVAVAALAVWFALAWSSEVLASLGLVTAALAPPFVSGHLTAREAGASAVAAAAALAVGQARRWWFVGLTTYAVGFVQALAVVADDDRWPAFAVAVVYFALALGGAAAYQRRRTELSWLASLLASSSLPLALVAVHELVAAPPGDAVFRGNGQALALAVVAVVYAAAAALMWARGDTRRLAEPIAALGLAAIALATATLLSNASLVAAWSIEGLALAALAARTASRRYYAVAVAYLGLALAHVLIFDEPLRRLFHEHGNPAAHIGSLLIVTGAAAIFAALLHGRHEPVEHARLMALGIAGTLALYAASLIVLQLAASFQRGQTIVSALWALVALALIGVGLGRRLRAVKTAGIALLGAALAKLFLFDLSQLSSLARVASFLSVGLVLLAAAFVVQHLTNGELRTDGN